MLTQQKPLKYMTTLPFRKIISKHSLIRKNAAYCRICLHEWGEQGKILYEPLAWQFEIVKRCPIHGIFLVDTCRSCNTPVPHLYPKRKIGWCHHCGEWLGVPLYRSLSRLTSEEGHVSTDIEGNEVGRLLFAIQNTLAPICRDNINKFLSKLIMYVDGRTLENVGWSGPYPPELKIWNKYPLKLEVGALDYICGCLGISWVDFFQDIPIDFSDPHIQLPTDLVLATNPRRPKRIGWRWEKKCYRGDLPEASKYLRYAAETLRGSKDWEFLLRDLKQKVANGEVG